ncbi:MAG: TIGR03545 family protein, partial [Nitrospiraceae bacterium]
MSKWIRWPGVIAFVVVFLLVAGVWFLVVDRVIKRVIEKTGTILVGAKVELDEADLSLFPLGLTLSRLQVTNPDQPMMNAVEVARIAFSMDSLNLLRRKVIIEEATVDGVRLNTPRTISGAIASRPAEAEPVSKKAVGDLFSLPSFSATDVQEILSKEELRSQKLVESLRTDLQAEQEQWQKRLAALPDKTKLDSYKKRLEGLKSAGKGGLGGVVGGAGEALAFQQDLSRDLDQIKSAKNNFEDHVTGLRKRMDEAVRAPQEDARRLMEKYSLSGSGMGNVTGMLVGGTIGDWTATSLRWYAKLQPVLQRKAERKRDVEIVKPVRGKGVDVRFKERAPLPDLLIRTAHVSVEVPTGAIRGQVKNITPDQPLLGIPLTFELAGDKLKGLQSVKLDGTLSRVDPARPSDRANLRVRGYRVEDLSLSKSEQWALALKQALADMDLQATLRGEALNAKLAA